MRCSVLQDIVAEKEGINYGSATLGKEAQIVCLRADKERLPPAEV